MNGSRTFLLPFIERSKGSMSILVVGGDSAEMFRQQTGGGHGYVQHWSGRKNRDLTKSIPKDTEAVVVVLDRVSHRTGSKGPNRSDTSRPSCLLSKASKARRSIGS
jgi:hypothetical protein